MTRSEILTAARVLVARGWSQEAGSRDAQGMPTRSKSPLSVAYCAQTAVFESNPYPMYSDERYRLNFDAILGLMFLIEKREGEAMYVQKWNDRPGRTWGDVVALFNEAIVLFGDT